MTTRKEYRDLAKKLPTLTGRAALGYAAAGLAVYAPAQGAKIPDKGTKGIEGRTSATATRDINTLFGIYTENPDNNVAICLKLCDPPIVSIDTDSAKGHPLSQEDDPELADVDGSTIFHRWYVQTFHESLPNTWTIQTATGGVNYLFRLPEGKTPPKTFVKALPRVDFLSDGQMMPPSYNKDANSRYRWARYYNPDDGMDIATIPDCLLEYWEGLTKPATTKGTAAQYAVNRAKTISETETGIIAEGARQTTLFEYARALVVEGVHGDELAARVRRVNDENLNPPLPSYQVDDIINRAPNYSGKGKAKRPEVVVEDMPSLTDNKYLTTTAKGTYKVVNAAALLWFMEHPAFGMHDIHYDVFRHFITTGPLPWNANVDRHGNPNPPREWTDVDTSQMIISFEQSLCGFDIPCPAGDGPYMHALRAHADNNRVNSLAEFLDQLKWDGVRRIDTLFSDYIGCEESPYNAAAAWVLISAGIMRAHYPGCYLDKTIIFSGPQGCGKSSFLNWIAINPEWFTDDLGKINGANKDTQERLRGKWICELPELATVESASNEVVKSFLTRGTDNYRTCYDKLASDKPRTSVFVGTTNATSYLKDPTGARRYIPVTCGLHPPKYAPYGTDDASDGLALYNAKQIWAEGMELFRANNRRLDTNMPEEFNEQLQLMREAAYLKTTVEDVVRTWCEDHLQDGDLTCIQQVIDANFTGREGDRALEHQVREVMDHRIKQLERVNRTTNRPRIGRYRPSSYYVWHD